MKQVLLQDAQYAAEVAGEITIELEVLMATTAAYFDALEEGVIRPGQVDNGTLFRIHKRLYSELHNQVETLRQYVASEATIAGN